MTLNRDKFDFFSEFSATWQFCEPTTAKHMMIDLYCHRLNFSPLNGLFNDV